MSRDAVPGQLAFARQLADGPVGHPTGHRTDQHAELRAAVHWAPRVARVAGLRPQPARLVERLVTVAVQGLPRLYRWDVEEFADTCAAWRDRHGQWRTTLSGPSHRATAIVTLGTHLLPEHVQRLVLRGRAADDLAARLVERVDLLTDVGDIALTCWAAAELGRADTARALARLAEIDTGQALPTAVAAWVVCALLAAHRLEDVACRLGPARDRLLRARRAALFVPATRGRALQRVAYFTDQAYAIAALARLHAVLGDTEALAVAQDCAARLARWQGEHGQWGYAYDARGGELVDPYPVRAAHQYALAPLALLDLAETGGDDHSAAVRHGLAWLSDRPETAEPLIADDLGLIWSGAGRSVLADALRPLHHVFTRVAPRWRPLGLDVLFPPSRVARVCRPADLGWLLYAWLTELRLSATRRDRMR